MTNNVTITEYLIKTNGVFLKCWHAVTTQHYSCPHSSFYEIIKTITQSLHCLSVCVQTFLLQVELRRAELS